MFLRPDPVTWAAVTAVTGQLRSQYGLVSAGAFPPHATLGHPGRELAAGRDEAGLVAAVDGAARTASAFEVHNGGVRRLGEVLVYDIHSIRGRPNRPLIELAAAVDAAVRPVLGARPAGQLPADVHDPGRWHAHVSLATHELFTRPELFGEVEAYVRGLGVPVPTSFTADTVGLYRFEHPTWAGSWWQEMHWEYVRGWTLPAAGR